MTPQSYATLYQLTPQGLELFTRIMHGSAPEESLALNDRAFLEPLPGTGPFEARDYGSARELAAAVCKSLRERSPHELADRTGLWAWLTFVLRDCLFAKSGGIRKVGEMHRWYPSPPGDYQKAQRHLVRMPTLLYASLAEDADHLLLGKPSVHGELREQLTAQQDMLNRNFQKVARQLYYVDATDSFKRGAAGSGGGSARRLGTIRKQLDVTWDMTDMSAGQILKLLPPEFDAYR